MGILCAFNNSVRKIRDRSPDSNLSAKTKGQNGMTRCTISCYLVSCRKSAFTFVKFVLKDPIDNNPALVRMMPNKREAIIWTKDGLVYWRIYAPLGLHVLTLCNRLVYFPSKVALHYVIASGSS